LIKYFNEKTLLLSLLDNKSVFIDFSSIFISNAAMAIKTPEKRNYFSIYSCKKSIDMI